MKLRELKICIVQWWKVLIKITKEVRERWDKYNMEHNGLCSWIKQIEMKVKSLNLKQKTIFCFLWSENYKKNKNTLPYLLLTIASEPTLDSFLLKLKIPTHVTLFQFKHTYFSSPTHVIISCLRQIILIWGSERVSVSQCHNQSTFILSSVTIRHPEMYKCKGNIQFGWFEGRFWRDWNLNFWLSLKCADGRLEEDEGGPEEKNRYKANPCQVHYFVMSCVVTETKCRGKKASKTR